MKDTFSNLIWSCRNKRYHWIFYRQNYYISSIIDVRETNRNGWYIVHYQELTWGTVYFFIICFLHYVGHLTIHILETLNKVSRLRRNYLETSDEIDGIKLLRQILNEKRNWHPTSLMRRSFNGSLIMVS